MKRFLILFSVASLAVCPFVLPLTYSGDGRTFIIFTNLWKYKTTEVSIYLSGINLSFFLAELLTIAAIAFLLSELLALIIRIRTWIRAPKR